MSTHARTTVHAAASKVDADESFDRLAQIGLVARGIVYLVFGVIAFNLSRGDEDAGRPSTEGALAELAGKSYGGVLLVLLAVGLAAYAAACAAGAMRGRGGKRPGRSDTSDRLIDAGRAIVNATLAVVAFQVFREGRNQAGGGSDQEQRFTARVLDWPAGRWMVVAGALGVAGWGLWQIKKAITGSFEKGLSFAGVSIRVQLALRWFGRLGYTARGAVLLMVSWFLYRAGMDHDPGDAVGIDGALQRVMRADWGGPVLAGVGVGVVAFGCWSMVEGRYRRSTSEGS